MFNFLPVEETGNMDTENFEPLHYKVIAKFQVDFRSKHSKLFWIEEKHLSLTLTLCQTVRFGDWKAVHSALVSTWVKGDAACIVFNEAVLSSDARSLQRDICHATAQCCPPCNHSKTFSQRHLQDREYFCEVFLG